MVLRFDDRGVNLSEGKYSEATTDDFVSDVISAFSFLSNLSYVDSKNIGLLGHSEGGIIATKVSNIMPQVGFQVLLSSPTLRGDDLLLLQKRKIETALNIPSASIEASQQIFKGAYDIIKETEKNDEALKKNLNKYFSEQLGSGMPSNQISSIVNQLNSNWLFDFIRYDPITALSKIDIPTLMLFGENDLQVPPIENKKRLAQLDSKSRRNLTVIVMDDLNHLYQESDSGLPQYYSQIEQTFSPKALEVIGTWLSKNILSKD